jgi:hypothetical protein
LADRKSAGRSEAGADEILAEGVVQEQTITKVAKVGTT